MDTPLSPSPNFQGPDRQNLLRLLDQRIRAFEGHGKLGKLLSQPQKTILSEASKQFRRSLYTTIETFWGARMNVTLPEPVSTFLYRYNYYEKELSTLLLRVLTPGNCFLDVGSHYGYFSLLAAHLVGEMGKVVAFEPTPRTYAVLNSNVAPYAQILTENLAVWSEAKTLEITDLGMAWSSHNSLIAPKMIPIGAAKHATKHEIKAIKLDDYVAEHNLMPTLIKIDAESAELAILKGMTETLTKLKPIISIEVGDDGDSNLPVRSTDAVKYCTTFDYQAFAFENGKIVPHEIKERYGYDNIFMFPRGRHIDER